MKHQHRTPAGRYIWYRSRAMPCGAAVKHVRRVPPDQVSRLSPLLFILSLPLSFPYIFTYILQVRRVLSFRLTLPRAFVVSVASSDFLLSLGSTITSMASTSGSTPATTQVTVFATVERVALGRADPRFRKERDNAITIDLNLLDKAGNASGKQTIYSSQLQGFMGTGSNGPGTIAYWLELKGRDIAKIDNSVPQLYKLLDRCANINTTRKIG